MPVVEATFVMTAQLGGAQTDRDKLVEAAMVEAVRKAQMEGVTDPAAVRALILAARDTAA